jgi:sugar O-acyltransferase (sialic acid O-acetyltransferase NeuD family)
MVVFVLNKRKLFIIGASHFGREMESWLELIPEAKRDWQLVGYLHTYFEHSPLEGFPSDYQIVGGWEEYPLTKKDYCIIAVADCVWKEKIYNHLKRKVSFYTYISPDAVVGKFNQISEGSIVCPKCIISTNVVLGKCVTINSSTQLGHDVTVGDFTSIMGSVNLNGGVSVGSKVYIGSKATIIPKTLIEDNSMVGAGSVVIRKVKTGTTVFGNPAKVIKY